MAIHFIDDDKFDITFTKLIVNASSLNKYRISVNVFLVENNLLEKTKGKLLVMTEINQHGWDLKKTIDSILITKESVPDRDYPFVLERLICGAGNSIRCLLNQELPELVEIDWIGSKIKMNGNFIRLQN